MCILIYYICVLRTASVKYARKHTLSIPFSMFGLKNMLNKVFLPKCRKGWGDMCVGGGFGTYGGRTSVGQCWPKLNIWAWVEEAFYLPLPRIPPILFLPYFFCWQSPLCSQYRTSAEQKPHVNLSFTTTSIMLAPVAI